MKKNNFSINYTKKTIEGTKTALKKAGVLDSPEYNELCELMNRFPNYKVREVSPKKKEGKKTYGGLTIQTMKDYITLQPNSETMLKKFEAVQRVAKAKGALYPLTKKWFFAAYPEYKKNSISETESDNAAAAEAARLEKEAEKEIDALENSTPSVAPVALADSAA